MKHILESVNFAISIEPQIFGYDRNLPTNTILRIEVESDGFAANTTMDTDIKYLAKFSNDLCHLYKNLKGQARLEEPYGQHMYLSFIGDGRGHIEIEGQLRKSNSSGSEQVLEFENVIDQTYLKPFCFDLLSFYENYLPK